MLKSIISLVLWTSVVLCTSNQDDLRRKIEFIVCTGNYDISAIELSDTSKNQTVTNTEFIIKSISLEKSLEFLGSYYKNEPKFSLITLSLPFNFDLKKPYKLIFKRKETWYYVRTYEYIFFDLNLKDVVLDTNLFSVNVFDEKTIKTTQNDVKRIHLAYGGMNLQTYMLLDLVDLKGNSTVNGLERDAVKLKIPQFQHFLFKSEISKFFETFFKQYNDNIKKDLVERSKANPVLSTNFQRIEHVASDIEEIDTEIEQNMKEMVTNKVQNSVKGEVLNCSLATKYLDLIRLVDDLIVSPNSLSFVSALQNIIKNETNLSEHYTDFLENLNLLKDNASLFIKDYLEKSFITGDNSIIKKMNMERFSFSEEFYNNIIPQKDLDDKLKDLQTKVEKIKNDEDALTKNEQALEKEVKESADIVKKQQEEVENLEKELITKQEMQKEQETVLKAVDESTKTENLPSVTDIIRLLGAKEADPSVREETAAFIAKDIELMNEFILDNEDLASTPLYLSLLTLRDKNSELIKQRMGSPSA